MTIVLTDVAGKDHSIQHDLHFREAHYETKHVITFKNPKGDLVAALRASGSVPGDTGGDLANGKKGGRASGVGGGDDGDRTRKRKKPDSRGVDMDLLADKLQKLGEDDLLQVVEMVHDNKTENSWMRNDVDRKSSLVFSYCALSFDRKRTRALSLPLALYVLWSAPSRPQGYSD